MVPAHERFYGSMPTSTIPPPFVSHEPRVLPKMNIPLTTLKNPSSTGMWSNEAMAKADHLPMVATMKGWGINHSA